MGVEFNLNRFRELAQVAIGLISDKKRLIGGEEEIFLLSLIHI